MSSLEKAEILITDNSSIVFEFLLVFKRPIIYLDYKEKIHNIDLDKLSIEIIDDKFKSDFGNKLDVKNLENLNELCENLINKNNISDQLVDRFEKNYFSNLNNSASFAASYLTNKLKVFKNEK